MSRPVDLVPACEAFLAVMERGSFSIGAAAIQVSQPVVSRRVRTLERVLGGELLRRSSAGVGLTSFGHDMLPAIRRVIEATDALAELAEHRRTAPVRMALPRDLDVAAVARLCVSATELGSPMSVVHGDPIERAKWLADDEVDAAALPCAVDAADWRITLGFAHGPRQEQMRFADLRPSRGRAGGLILWTLPEDNTPVVRDPLERLRDRHGPAAKPIRVTTTSQAIAKAFTEGHVVLCGAREARRFGLSWHTPSDLGLERGGRVRVRSGMGAATFGEQTVLLANLLGADREEI